MDNKDNKLKVGLNMMASTSFDPNRFKIVQRQNWDSVAKGWNQWSTVHGPVEKGAQRLSNRLVELARIRPGQRIPDIATGIGEPAVSVAKVVGRGGSLQIFLEKC